MPGAKPVLKKPSVIQRLLDAPQRFQFVQAVRVFEAWLIRQGVAPEEAVDEYLRFQNSTTLGFPASEIEALTADAATAISTDVALSEALSDQTLKHIRITPAFMGLLGANGALPYHYTERIANQSVHEKNDAPRAFLDTYSSRALALYYKAWSKYRPEFLIDQDGKGGFQNLLLALAGLRPRPRDNAPSDAAAEDISDETLAYYAGVLRHRPVSATVMQRVLSEYFGVPFAMEEFVGCWHDLDEQSQTAFGGPNAVIGKAIGGTRVWRADLCMRIRIGPLARNDYERFLPRASGAKALTKMLAMFAGPPVSYEVHPVLRAQDVVSLCASSGDDHWGKRFGFDAFIFSGPSTVDRDDMFYVLNP